MNAIAREESKLGGEDMRRSLVSNDPVNFNSKPKENPFANLI